MRKSAQSAKILGMPPERGHSCPQQLPNTQRDRNVRELYFRSTLLRTRMSALRFGSGSAGLGTARPTVVSIAGAAAHDIDFYGKAPLLPSKMQPFPPAIDLKRLRVFPLAERRSLSRVETLLVDPGQPAAACGARELGLVEQCAAQVTAARRRGASVILMYGAHLIKNGAQRIVNELVGKGWITHLATNGAGTIHDWELAFLGRTEESVKQNVASGTFGTWDETGRCMHLALLAGALQAEGYGRSLGRFIQEDGFTLPEPDALKQSLCNEPAHPLTPARAELLQAMVAHQLPAG